LNVISHARLAVSRGLNRPLLGVVLALSCLTLAGSPPPLQASSTPVCRFGLEHWTADPFDVYVFHQGPLTPTDLATVDSLSQVGIYCSATANLRVRDVDLTADDVDPSLRKLAAAHAESPQPYIVVRYPHGSVDHRDAWFGVLADAVIQLPQSSAREEIAERLLA